MTARALDTAVRWTWAGIALSFLVVMVALTGLNPYAASGDLQIPLLLVWLFVLHGMVSSAVLELTRR